jgi:hypothetical protein
MDRNAENIGQIISNMQRELEELKTTQTKPIPDSSIKARMIDWSTIPSGRIDSAEYASGRSSIQIEIPEQPNSDYKVLITIEDGGSYWTYIRYRVSARALDSFTIEVYNDSTNTAQNVSFSWLLIPGQNNGE